MIIAVKALGVEVTEAGLISFFGDKVAEWQISDRVIFVDELPRTFTVKVLKSNLRDRFGDVRLPESIPVSSGA